MIKKLSKYFNEIFISTGATYDDEIASTGDYLNSINKEFTFLHCVTIYPTPLNLMNLTRMDFIKKWTNQYGLSDHSLTSADGVKAAIAAVYLGANVIERHFTILAENETRDGPVSIRKNHITEILDFSKLSKSEQKYYIEENIPEYQSMLGQMLRKLSKEEELNRNYYRGRFCNKIKGKTYFNWEEEVLSVL